MAANLPFIGDQDWWRLSCLTGTQSEMLLSDMHRTHINVSPSGRRQTRKCVHKFLLAWEIWMLDKWRRNKKRRALYLSDQTGWVYLKQLETTAHPRTLQSCCPFDPLTRLLTLTRHNVFSHECSVNRHKLPLTLKRKYFYGLQAPLNKFKAA